MSWRCAGAQIAARLAMYPNGYTITHARAFNPLHRFLSLWHLARNYHSGQARAIGRPHWLPAERASNGGVGAAERGHSWPTNWRLRRHLLRGHIAIEIMVAHRRIIHHIEDAGCRG